MSTACRMQVWGGLLAAKDGKAEAYAPCTPQAVMELLEYYGIDVTGKKVTVVRTELRGRPSARRNADAQKRYGYSMPYEDPGSVERMQRGRHYYCSGGKAKLIGREHTSAGQVLIDVGINFLDGKLCGDFDYESTSRQAAAATPVPGGVGAVTTSVLLKHTVDSAGKLC